MIAIFDNSPAGLSLTKKLQQLFPQYNIVYVCDFKNYPYTYNTTHTIQQNFEDLIQLLNKHQPKLLIIPNHTLSAVYLKFLYNKYPKLKIIDSITPIIEHISTLEINNKIGIIGSPSLIETNIYPMQIRTKNSKITIVQQNIPLLTDLILHKLSKTPMAKKILKHNLRIFKDNQIKTIILANNIYYYSLRTIKTIMGKQTTLIESNKILLEYIKHYLTKETELREQLSKSSKFTYIVNDNINKFKTLAQIFTGKDWCEKYLN